MSSKKNINVKLATHLDICFQQKKKQASSKPRRPKAYQLQTGAVYVKDSALSLRRR